MELENYKKHPAGRKSRKVLVCMTETQHKFIKDNKLSFQKIFEKTVEQIMRGQKNE